MGIQRYENSISNSDIRAIITCFDPTACGLAGPRFTLQMQDWTMLDIASSQLADFLNTVTGKDGAERIISEKIEQNLLLDFSNVLTTTEEGRYAYVGTAEANQYYVNSYSAAMALNKVISAANAHEQPVRKGTFPARQAYAVLQKEIAITNGTSEKPILGSYGAGPCVIVAVCDPIAQQAVLAHMDSLTHLPSLNYYLNRVFSFNYAFGVSDKAQVHLAGGDDMSRQYAANLINLINDRADMKIVSARICDDHEPNSLAIDARTCEVFTNFSPKQLTHPEDYKLRLETLASQFVESPLRESIVATNQCPIGFLPDETNSIAHGDFCQTFRTSMNNFITRQHEANLQSALFVALRSSIHGGVAATSSLVAVVAARGGASDTFILCTRQLTYLAGMWALHFASHLYGKERYSAETCATQAAVAATWDTVYLGGLNLLLTAIEVSIRHTGKWVCNHSTTPLGKRLGSSVVWLSGKAQYFRYGYQSFSYGLDHMVTAIVTGKAVEKVVYTLGKPIANFVSCMLFGRPTKEPHTTTNSHPPDLPPINKTI